jgi:uncharacterized membrane protein
MLRALRHRARAQVFPLTAVVMVAAIGGLAMVVDVGMFFIVQRQFQTAADAGALAGAWYNPVCVVPAAGCQTSRTATEVAQEVALANANSMRDLCGGVIPPPTVVAGTRINLPARVNAIVVTVECDAGYTFGRILNLSTAHISASSAAIIGMHLGDGEIGDMPTSQLDCATATPRAYPTPYPTTNQPTCLLARLIE